MPSPILRCALPTSFLPVEDQGQVMAQVSLPAGAKSSRTAVAAEQLRQYFMNDEKDNVAFAFILTGFSFQGQGENVAQGFINLAPWDERKGSANSAGAIAERANKQLSAIRDAKVLAMTPPAIRGLGQSNGFTFELLNSGGLSRDRFLALRNQLIAAAANDPILSGVRAATLEDTPQLQVDIDSEKLAVLGLTQSSVDNVLSSAWGSTYINDFVDRGRVKRVYMQADAKYRMMPEDMDYWYVRNQKGEMVPISAVSSTEWTYGSPRLERFNGLSSLNIQGAAAPGVASGDAMAAMEQLVSQLPGDIGLEWQGLSYEEREAGEQGPALYALSMIVVFLCLAALYESWSIPISVMMVVPLGVLGAVIAAMLRGLPDDVYFQVAILTTIGLSAKNAILIVEFARELYDDGMSLLDATVEAARQRLRPIIMTSMAFTLGVVPLAISTGAGAGARVAVGTGVMGGMIAATVLAIFFVPLFFVLIVGTFAKNRTKRGEVQAAHEHPAE